MKQFVLPELKYINMNACDILSTSEEASESTQPTGTTDNRGGIITPPDEFDRD